MSFSSHKNRELKVKLWWVGACERKKRAFFVTFILSEGNFSNICVLSHCIENRTNVQNIYFIYFYISKNITSYTFLLVFKNVESLQCILNLFTNPTTHHVYSTLKRRGNGCFHVVSTWNTLSVCKELYRACLILFNTNFLKNK